jgi:hypothetical protein
MPPKLVKLHGCGNLHEKANSSFSLTLAPAVLKRVLCVPKKDLRFLSLEDLS